MMKLKMHISKIKCIRDLTIELPIERGLYAITGQNGSGKSTIVACASSVFFNLPMKDYFGDYIEDILTRLMEREQDFMSLIPCNYNSNKKVNVKAA